MRCRIRPALGHRSCRRCLEKAKRWRDRIRADALAAYGGRCQCCGEDTPAFLLVAPDGSDDHSRFTLNAQRGGWTWYRKVRRAGYPAGLRILCWNCWYAVQAAGQCAHVDARRLLVTAL